jgi:ribosome-interacting GTPase 1
MQNIEKQNMYLNEHHLEVRHDINEIDGIRIENYLKQNDLNQKILKQLILEQKLKVILN